MSTRINYIDQLKGLAMLLVVMGHVSAFDFFSLETVPGTFLNNIITSLQMPLFFFLSGIVVRKKDLRLGGGSSRYMEKIQRTDSTDGSCRFDIRIMERIYRI